MLPPVLTVAPGDVAFVEMISHHAGDDPARMIEGDEGLEVRTRGPHARRRWAEILGTTTHTYCIHTSRRSSDAYTIAS